MNERKNPFGDLDAPPVFATKARAEKPPERAGIARLAEENNFPSRQARNAKQPRREWRLHRTGRNVQFNAKATQETVERFYRGADDRRMTLGEMLKLGLDAQDMLEPFRKIADARRIPLDKLLREVLAELGEEPRIAQKAG